MIDPILKKLNSLYTLNELSKQNIKLAKTSFSIQQFNASGLGNVAVLQSKKFFGLIKTETIIINPFERDIPLLTYKRTCGLFKDVLRCEMLDTRVENGVVPEYIKKLNEYKGKYDINIKPSWNKDILFKENIYKKTINRNLLDSITTNFFNAYLRWSIQVGVYDKHLRKAKAKAYTEDLLRNGNHEIDVIVREKGREYTQELYRNVILGTK